MKRLLAYLFLVLGLGLVVNNFAFAKCMRPNFCEFKNDDGSFFKGICDRETGEKDVGTFTYANGDIYIGHFGVRPAENVLKRLKDLNIYTGSFGHGKRHGGGGTLLKTNGDKYVGVWKFDKLIIGTYWKNNKLVEYFPKNKKIISAVIDSTNDRFLTGTGNIKKNQIKIIIDKGTFKKGEGIIFYQDGYIYVGEFKEGKKDGYGRLYFPEGDQFDCITKDGPWKNDGWGGPIA